MGCKLTFSSSKTHTHYTLKYLLQKDLDGLHSMLKYDVFVSKIAWYINAQEKTNTQMLPLQIQTSLPGLQSTLLWAKSTFCSFLGLIRTVPTRRLVVMCFCVRPAITCESCHIFFYIRITKSPQLASWSEIHTETLCTQGMYICNKSVVCFRASILFKTKPVFVCTYFTLDLVTPVWFCVNQVFQNIAHMWSSGSSHVQ